MTTPQTVQPAAHPPASPQDAEGRSAADIEADLAATRERLAGTIDALVDRVNPKNVARRGLADLRSKVTTAEGGVRPEVVAGAVGVVTVVALLVWRSRRSRRS